MKTKTYGEVVGRTAVAPIRISMKNHVTRLTRRVAEELGLTVDLRFVYKFEYHAEWKTGDSEHELCSVFVGAVDRDPIVNPTEIQEWRWASVDDVDAAIDRDAPDFTPWLKLEWRELRQRGFPARLCDTES